MQMQSLDASYHSFAKYSPVQTKTAMLHVLTIYSTFLFVFCQCSYPTLKINHTALSGLCGQFVANRSWLYKMMDATSKFPPGILEGNTVDLGHYDQCIEIEEQTSFGVVLGKYCPRAATVRVGDGILVSLSVCIPHVCMLEDYYDHGEFFFKDRHCHTKKVFDEVNLEDNVAMVVFAVVFIFVSLCTSFDLYKVNFSRGKLHPIATSFSLIANSRRLFHQTSQNFQSLHGLRALSILYVCLGHRYSMAPILPTFNYSQVALWSRGWSSVVVQGAITSVDTFFFMSAFLYSQQYFRSLKDGGLKVYLLKIYLRRYLRLTPSVMLFYLASMTLWRFSPGPSVMTLKDHLQRTCSNGRWTLFLYLHNFGVPKDMCLPHLWYLSVDFQLFLIAPLILAPLGNLHRKNLKILAAFAGTFLLLASMILHMVVGFYSYTDNDYATHPRFLVYMVGIIMGMVTIDASKSDLISMKCNRIVWCAVLSTMCLIVIGQHEVFVFPNPLKKTLFYTFSRPMWGLCLGWIVYSCTIGTGGAINKLLTHPSLQLISKISYSLYFVHALVLGHKMSTMRVPEYFNDYYIISESIGYLAVSMLAAMIWTLFVEYPASALLNIWMRKVPETKVTYKDSIKIA